MPAKLFKSDTLQEADKLAAYLEAVREGFAAGRLVLSQGGEELALSPRGLVAFSVEGKANGADRKLKLTFRWKEGAGEPLPAAPLVIKS